MADPKLLFYAVVHEKGMETMLEYMPSTVDPKKAFKKTFRWSLITQEEIKGSKLVITDRVKKLLDQWDK